LKTQSNSTLEKQVHQLNVSFNYNTEQSVAGV